MAQPAADHSPPHVLPAVSVILVNWNNWRDCTECIDSLLGMDYPQLHIFIIDNESGDGSVEQIVEWCRKPLVESGHKNLKDVALWTQKSPPSAIAVQVIASQGQRHPVAINDYRVSIVCSGGNLGFAGGCNVGIRSAGVNNFKYFWFLNTDTVVERNCLRHMVARAELSADVGMVGSTVLYYDHPDVLQAQAGAWLNPQTGESRHIGEGTLHAEVKTNADEVERQLAYIFGASMLVSNDLIRQVGLMREDYFLYYEEMDWAMRSKAFFRFGYAPQSVVYHKAGNSSSKNMPLFTANYFYRNRIRFMSRFFPQCLNATKRQLFITLAWCVTKRRWSEARLIIGILYRSDTIAHDAIENQPAAVLP